MAEVVINGTWTKVPVSAAVEIQRLRMELRDLKVRYWIASGLALSWGNYFNRDIMESSIDEMIADSPEEIEKFLQSLETSGDNQE